MYVLAYLFLEVSVLLCSPEACLRAFSLICKQPASLIQLVYVVPNLLLKTCHLQAGLLELSLSNLSLGALIPHELHEIIFTTWRVACRFTQYTNLTKSYKPRN